MSGPQGRLRLIGGRYRGRRLGFPAVGGLRPTTDRVRETLFNWLQGQLEGARCLDLFAGSGALGLEALSRGAARVVMVERDRRAAAALSENLSRLGDPHGEVVTADACRYLRRTPEPFDVAFVDPPFRQGLLQPALEGLSAGWVAPGGWVYVECGLDESPTWPPQWQLVREKRAGQLDYRLLRLPPATTEAGNP